MTPTKPKVGDRVRYTGGMTLDRIGKEGNATAVDYEGTRVAWDDGRATRVYTKHLTVIPAAPARVGLGRVWCPTTGTTIAVNRTCGCSRPQNHTGELFYEAHVHNFNICGCGEKKNG